MENNPLISVIVPIYNVEQYIHETLGCIINQTYDNWECILIDDGSSDNSSAICDEYAKNDSRIRVIHKSNGGLVSARNAGYENIAGDWHMYLDGDDWIDVNTCEELVKAIKKYPDVNVVFWKFLQEFNGKSVKSKMNWNCLEDEQLYEGEQCHDLALNTMVYSSGLTTAYAKLINTKWAKENGINVLEAEDFIRDVWNHPRTVEFRNALIGNTDERGCRNCPAYEVCGKKGYMLEMTENGYQRVSTEPVGDIKITEV